MSFTIGSLFDGSGGFPLAATMCSGTPIWAAEVEPYPIAVTTSRFPNMKHLGSVTDVKGNEVEPVDVLCFGAPCQDLSIAGLRKGLRHDSLGDGETTRSGLFMEAVRIIKEMREATNGVYPRFAIYENVPGAFSSSKGQDFRIVLEELIKIVEPTAVMPEVPKNGWPYADSYCGDGWSIAYRVLDAQFWGVPQRRRRIYLVADFRGECAGKVLFEREGLRGYFAEGRTPRQETARYVADGSGAYDCAGDLGGQQLNVIGADIYNLALTGDMVGSLTAEGYSSTGSSPKVLQVIACIDGDKIGKAERAGGSGLGIRDGDNMYTLTAKDVHCVCIPINDKATRWQGGGVTRNHDGSGNGLGVGQDGDPSPTLTAGDRHAVAFQTYQRVTGPLMANSHPGSYTGQDAFSDMLVAGVYEKSGFSDYTEGKFGTLRATGGDQGGGSESIVVAGVDCRNATECPEKTGTLQAHPGGGFSLNCNQVVRVQYIVRRLTPTECARLQGFPDTWGHPDLKAELTDEEYQFWLNIRNTHAAINDKATKEYTKDQILKWYNGLHTDSSEYKMWGNGIALPNALYVMQGIADVMSEEKASRKKWLDELLGDCL